MKGGLEITGDVVGSLETSVAPSSANKCSHDMPLVQASVFSCKLKRTHDLKILKKHGINDDAAVVVIDMTKHMKRDPDQERIGRDQTGLVEAFRQRLSQDPGMETALAGANDHYRSRRGRCVVVFACNKGKHRSVSAAELFAKQHGLVVRHLDVAEHLNGAERELVGKLRSGQTYVQTSYVAPCTERCLASPEVMTEFSPQLQRCLSEEYQSKGASSYDEATLRTWLRHRDAAASAMRKQDWRLLGAELRAAIDLRPDWGEGWMGLHTALLKRGDADAADQALKDGIAACGASVRTTLAAGLDAKAPSCGIVQLAGKMKERLGPDAACRVFGLQTVDDVDGSAHLLYRDVSDSSVGPILAASLPLKLLILDIDGVLNTSGNANTGTLVPMLLARLHSIVAETSCVVAISSSWRSFHELRPLIVAALPAGCVVGQTPHGFQNFCRPREVAELLNEPHLKTQLAQPGARWAIVDDMNLLKQAEALAATDTEVSRLLPELKLRFVRTDQSVGLNDMATKELLRLLS